ncbi:MAG: 50S ribosomal protein L31e [Candidatus Woesearchaeota archaeon]|nr:MAG: 50S ribosomal protein L31e [Candidatus Woesearchaeota archaeon]
MAEERIYNVPLRNNWKKVPKWRRSKRASTHLREFLLKHTNAKEIKIGQFLNEAIWKHGGENPPGKIKVKVTEDEDGVWKAELAELSERAKRIIKQKEELEKKRKKRLDILKEKLKAPEEEEKTEEEKKEEEEKKKKAKVTKEQEMQLKK